MNKLLSVTVRIAHEWMHKFDWIAHSHDRSRESHLRHLIKKEVMGYAKRYKAKGGPPDSDTEVKEDTGRDGG